MVSTCMQQVGSGPASTWPSRSKFSLNGRPSVVPSRRVPAHCGPHCHGGATRPFNSSGRWLTNVPWPIAWAIRRDCSAGCEAVSSSGWARCRLSTGSLVGSWAC